MNAKNIAYAAATAVGAHAWSALGGALRTVGFDGDFAALRKLTNERLGLAVKVQV